jgi:hypothetical protein
MVTMWLHRRFGRRFQRIQVLIRMIRANFAVSTFLKPGFVLRTLANNNRFVQVVRQLLRTPVAQIMQFVRGNDVRRGNLGVQNTLSVPRPVVINPGPPSGQLVDDDPPVDSNLSLNVPASLPGSGILFPGNPGSVSTVSVGHSYGKKNRSPPPRIVPWWKIWVVPNYIYYRFYPDREPRFSSKC